MKSRTKIFIFTILDMWRSKIQNIKINSVNPLYLIIKVNGYFGEINRSKYLTLVPANEIKEKI